MSCSINIGALGSPGLLSSCSIITIAISSHMTIILTMTCLSTSTSTSTILLYRYDDNGRFEPIVVVLGLAFMRGKRLTLDIEDSRVELV